VKYRGVHRQQLFHWIGHHIDYPDRDNQRRRIKKLEDSHRREYIQCLRSALESGLRLKIPNPADAIDDGRLIKVTRPILCFTEWSLGDSQPHVFKYGRLGLGLPKSFVLSKGGLPVAYIRDRRAAYVKALLHLAEHVRDLPEDRKHRGVKDDFDFVSQFFKALRKPGEKRRKSAPFSRERRKGGKSPDPFKRRFGGYLQYLEEREWRIVMSEAMKRKLKREDDGDIWCLPVRPGHELFTVVLPDNRTTNMALNDGFIRGRLFPTSGPHVTVLSLEDIPTF
jgi:hypothetical protein